MSAVIGALLAESVSPGDWLAGVVEVDGRVRLERAGAWPGLTALASSLP